MTLKVWSYLLVICMTNVCIESISNITLNAFNNETHRLQKRGLSSNQVVVGKPAPEWWKSWWREYITDVTDPTVRPFVLTGNDVNHILSLRNEIQTHVDEEEDSEEIVPPLPQIRTTSRPSITENVEPPIQPIQPKPSLPSRPPTFRPRPQTFPSDAETKTTAKEFLELEVTKKPPTRPSLPFRPQPSVGSTENPIETEITDSDDITEKPIRPRPTPVPSAPTFRPRLPTKPSQQPLFTRVPLQPTQKPIQTLDEEVVITETPIFTTERIPFSPSFRPRPTIGPLQPQQRPTFAPPVKGQPPPSFRPRPAITPPVKGPPPRTPRPRPTQAPATTSIIEIEEEVTEATLRPRPTISPPIKTKPQPTLRPVPRPQTRPPVKGQPTTRRPIPTLSPEEEEEVETEVPIITRPPIRSTIRPPIKTPTTLRPRPTFAPPVKGQTPPTFRPQPAITPRPVSQPTFAPPVKGPPATRPPPTRPVAKVPEPTLRPLPTKSPIQPTFRPRPPVKGQPPLPSKPTAPPFRPRPPPTTVPKQEQEEEEDITEPTTRPRPTIPPPIKGQPPLRPTPRPSQPRPTFAPPTKGQPVTQRPRQPTFQPRPSIIPPAKGPSPTRAPPLPRPRPPPTIIPEIEEEEELTERPVRPRPTIAPPVKRPQPTFQPRPSIIPPVKGPSPTRAPPLPRPRPPPTIVPEIEEEEELTERPVRPRPTIAPPVKRPQPIFTPRPGIQTPTRPPIKGQPLPSRRPTIAPPVKGPQPTFPRVPVTPRPRPTLPPVVEEEVTDLTLRPGPTISPPVKGPQPLPPRPTPAPPVKGQPTPPRFRPTPPTFQPRPTISPTIRVPQSLPTRVPLRPSFSQDFENDVTESPLRPIPTKPPGVKVPVQPTFRPQPRPPIREPSKQTTQRPIQEQEEEEEKTERPLRPRPTISPPIRSPAPPTFRPRPITPPIKGQPPSRPFQPRPPPREPQILETTITPDIEIEVTERPVRPRPIVSQTTPGSPPFGTRTTRPSLVGEPQLGPSPSTFVPPVRRPPVPMRQRIPLTSSTTEISINEITEPTVTLKPKPFISPELTTIEPTIDEEIKTVIFEDEEDITEPSLRPRPTPARPPPFRPTPSPFRPTSPQVRPPPPSFRPRDDIPPSPSRGRPPTRPQIPVPSISGRPQPTPVPSFPRPQGPSLQPSRKPLIGVKTAQRPGANDRSVLPYNPELGPSVTLIRPDRPLANGSMPPCSLQGKNFCILTNDYPMKAVKNVVDQSFQRIRLMYEELHTVGDPELFASHLGNSSASRGQFACETEAGFMRPGWAQDALKGDWMLIVNTDIFPQKVRTESCRRANQPCDFVAPFYESTCQQRFSLHRLIAIDPNDPNKSPVVALFKFPAGCSCRVDPIRKESNKKRKRETLK